jgi:hypothetical protein
MSAAGTEPIKCQFHSFALKGEVIMKTTESGDLYILLDGTHAAPGDCAKGDDGVMRAPSGVPVAMTGEGEPMTVKRQAEEGGSMKAAQMGREAAEAVESGAARPQMVEEKPADERPARNRLSEAMMPGHAPKPETKLQDKKAE